MGTIKQASAKTSGDVRDVILAVGLHMIDTNVFQANPRMVALIVGASVLAQIVVRM